MASGTLGGSESREKQRWGDNKVYTRKHHKGNKKNLNNNNNIVSVNNNNINNVTQQSSQTLATTTEDGNSSQPQNLSRFDAASDDSSSLNRVQVGAENGRAPANGNGPALGFVRFGNRVKISLSAAKSKVEVREWKRKLVGELDQVRGLVKKIEAKEVQRSGYSGAGGYTHSQVSASEAVEKVGGGMRMNLEVGSVGHRDSRRFCGGLSVSVVENNSIHGGGGGFVEKEKRTPKANQYYRNSDFVLGKEKFPQPESNKKLKTANGFGVDKYLNQAFKSCGNLLARLMKHKFAWVFNDPVNPKKLKLNDYFDVIKNPMDLGTIKDRLSKNWYKSPKEFAEDVRLTFHNAMTYNPKGQDVHFMAEQLLEIFEEKWASIEAEYNFGCRFDMGHKASLPTPISKKALPPVHHAPPTAPPQMRTLDRSESMTMPVDSAMKVATNLTHPGRMPVPKKPKAKDPRKRNMTYEEKQRLSTNLQSLPSEKLDTIVMIIKKRNSALSQHEDEIEVDIDSVDAETLWELDRFVTNYKKSLSKNKRKAEIAVQAREGPDHTVQETNPAQAVVEKPRETKIDGKIGSISPIQGEKQGNNVSRSSSSSSSSSDSGSSSSDSDSESSSVSGSDVGHSPRT